MKTALKEAKKCPGCGRPLPTGVLAGLCPACLLAQGMETDAGGRSFEPPLLPDVARLFPQLEFICLLGAGGMGAVYKARQPLLDRLVAVKILPVAGPGGVDFAERFNREARALARLNHPNIVAVHEFGQTGGLHFFIMEYVDGANLRQLEQAGRLSPREALQIIPQICDALQYAHDEGVVHRDIKPENVLVDRKGRVKIADFGLAKILGYDPEKARLTAEGQVMGTPHYMAPEQIERPLAVDHRADIYALGVVFYEMLTGDLPLGKFAPPSSKALVDQRFDEVVLRALENDPSRRYQQASEVKSRVENIAGTPTPAPSAAVAPEKLYIRWAGFPVVLEQNGRRSVNCKETLRVFALVFGLVTLGYLLTWLVTGHTIPGWASLLVRLSVSAVAVGWGVRSALRSKQAAAAWPRTPRGTVILSPRRRFFSFSTIMLGGLLAFAIAFSLLDIHWFRPLKGIPFFKSASYALAVRDSDSGTWVARLPGRGRVELLAVGDSWAAPNQWWLPDGTAIPQTLYELVHVGVAQSTGRTNKDFILRWRDLPEEATGPNLEFEPSAAACGGGEVLRDGNALDRAWPLRAAFPRSARKATLRVGFGVERWRTVASHDPNGNRSTGTVWPGVPSLETRVHQISENAGQAQVTMLMAAENRDWSVRIIALDTNGVEHTVSTGSASPVVEKTSICTYGFQGLPLAKVREFQVQVRAITWVEFRAVMLEPRDRAALGRSDRVFKPTAFSEPREMQLSELFDFDNGKAGEFPVAADGTKTFAGIERNPSWSRNHGYDVEAGTNELRLFHMVLVDLKPGEWDTISPEDLQERFTRGAYGPARLPSTPKGPLPLTHGFRTRDGAVGVLQVTGFAANHPAVSLRYKLIERAHYE